MSAAAGSPEEALPFSWGLWWGARLGLAFRWALACVALGLAWRGWVGPYEWAVLLVGYLLTTLGLTVGHHRLFSHRSFQAKAPLRLALALLGTMAWQGSPLAWAGMHRRHHQHTEGPGDPHSPHHPWAGWRGFWHAHLGWMFTGRPEPWVRWVPDLLQDPMLRAVHRWRILVVALGLALPALACGLWHGSWAAAWVGFFWGGMLRVVLQEQAVFCINSVSHLWGDRAFETPDQSRNLPWLSVLLLGEGWHNSHHAFPAVARHALFPGQWDPGHACIRWWIRWGWASQEVPWNPVALAARVHPDWAPRLAPTPEEAPRGRP